jgi:hypothetical protein
MRSLLITLIVLAPTFARGADATLKTEHFDQDPKWEGYNNHVVPKKVITVHQDFGYSATKFAGKEAGEMGGRVQRSTTPASYAAMIKAVTLDDRISASGSFAIIGSQPGAGLFFGFFNSDQPGGSGRPIGSLGMDFDFEREGGRMAVRMITSGNKSCGTFITPFLPGKFRPTPLKNDGTRYRFTLEYDPHDANDNGRFTFTLASDNHPIDPADEKLPEAHRAEALKRFPHTASFTVDVPPGLKKENATFDRFGLMNMMKAGGVATIYFDDLQVNGQAEDFSKEPGDWIGVGNRATFEDHEQTGAHNFGFSPETNHAGGEKPGEIGGGLWRSGPFAYYADPIGPLDLDHPIEARGKIKMVTAGPDSDIVLGFFNSASAKENAKGDAANFVGIHIGGPTRIGHYFSPGCVSAKGLGVKAEKGPILTPGKAFDWSLVYDPAANNNMGQITVTLGKDSVTLPLKAGQKSQGATLDRFGLFTITIGGQMVKIYLDDATYTVKQE